VNFTAQLVASQQERLAHLGWYHNKIDGIPGPATSKAFERFKASHGLAARDMPGPLTMSLLWGDSANKAPSAFEAASAGAANRTPPWLVEARNLLGTKEVAGPANNPVIMKWARNLDIAYSGDDVPWCGLFVAHCMAAGAPDQPQNFNRLGARSWLSYGVECPAWLGSIVVLWRTHPKNSWHGHVGLLTGANSTHLRIIGGNQSDNVTEVWVPRSRLLGFRGPEKWVGTDAPTSATGNVSTKES
jgi:uncharacterized protein (TIGR02594 family)